MKTAIILARVSNDDPESERLDDQLRECREYAERNNYQVVREIKENGVSGGTPMEKRPASAAVELLKARKVDVIIVRELDRLGRRGLRELVQKER